MSYMVVECHPGYAVVLDENGRFLKVANRHYEIGQMVSDITPMRTPTKSRKTWLYTLTAMAACLVLLLTTVLPVHSQPYASVYVKINPEVRIDVDKNDQVIGLEGVNDDGIALIQNYDFHNKDLELVTDELVDLAIDAGFLQADGTINLTLDSTDEAWVTGHGETLSNHIHNHMQTRFTVTIQVSLHHQGHDHHVDLPSQATPTVPASTELDIPVYHHDDDHDDDDDDHDDDYDDDHDDNHDDDYDDDHDDNHDDDYDDDHVDDYDDDHDDNHDDDYDDDHDDDHDDDQDDDHDDDHDDDDDDDHDDDHHDDDD